MNEKMIANKISGLSSKEVEERLKNGQNNKMVDENAATTSSNHSPKLFSTYFNLIFAIISLLCLLLGSFKSLTFFTLLSSLTLSSELLNNCALKKY